MTGADWKRELVAAAREEGAEACGVAAVPGEVGLEYYRRWIAEGRHGTMAWMEQNVEKRGDPRLVLPEAKSVVVLGWNYWQPAPARRGRIAQYALGADYHPVLLKKLKRLCGRMRSWGGAQKPYVDTGPVLEKRWAALAGLGWQGKNTILLNKREGQWLFLGVILTTLELPPDAPQKDKCGRCRLCLEVCPTQAFIGPYQLDARRCLSYWTIEHRGAIPEEFRRALGDRLFGCDACLEVCPWNRWEQATREAKFAARVYPDPRAMLEWEEADFRAVMAGSALRRPGLRGWKRNVCVVLGNIGTEEDVAPLERIAAGEDAMLAEHAAWAVAEIRGRRAGTAGGLGNE